MANNNPALERAKDECEPALVKAFQQPDCDFPLGAVMNSYQASEISDKKLHIDVLVDYVKQDGKMGLARIDAKDPDRIDTGNVTLPADEVEFFKVYDDETPRYFLAFRLNDGISVRYGKFRVFAAQDALSYIDEKQLTAKIGKNGKQFYLINLQDLTKYRPYFEVGLIDD